MNTGLVDGRSRSDTSAIAPQVSRRAGSLPARSAASNRRLWFILPAFRKDARKCLLDALTTAPLVFVWR
jgi:hypothetical protein